MHSVYVFSFWGLRPQPRTGTLPLDPAGGFRPSDPVLSPLSKFLATPLETIPNIWIGTMLGDLD